MRIAIVSDIHGNRTAFEAVLCDLRQTSPDLILHGGDLADSGSAPAEVVDCIRALGWQGVVGNTDEMLSRPASLREYAEKSPSLQPLFETIGELAEATREKLGEARLAWLDTLPRIQSSEGLTLLHASPASLWRAPGADASDAELESVYGLLGKPVVAYAHIHRSFIRRVNGVTLINTGSVSLSYDGDPRAAYLLLDGTEPTITEPTVMEPTIMEPTIMEPTTMEPTIRRVEYDLDRELKALADCGLPHVKWIAKMLTSASAVMPEGDA